MFARFGSVFTAVVVLALSGAAFPAAAAVTGDCLWQALPEAKRAEFLSSYRIKGFNALSDIKYGPEVTLQLQTRCQFKDSEATTVGEMLGAEIVEHGADLVLSEKNGIKTGALDTVWKGLSAADRDILEVFGMSLMKGESTGIEAVAVILQASQVKLKLPEFEANDHVFAYLAARGLREAREAGRR